MEVTGEQYGVILTPLILSRLPHDIRMEWARDGESHESDLEYLLTFLDKEIKRRERSQTFKPSADDKHTHGLTPSAAALVNRSAGSKGTQQSQQSQQSGNKCNLCNKRHSTEKCWDLVRSTLEDRKQKITGAKLCYRCFSNQHLANNCSVKCEKCNGRHHLLLCGGWPAKSGHTHQTNSNSSSTGVLLQMASTEACGQAASKVNLGIGSFVTNI